MKNKKAQIGFAIINMIAVFVIGFMLINFLMPESSDFRTNMNCDSVDTIHDGNKLLCLAGDLTIPYFVLLIISIGVGLITARLF